MIKYRGRNKSNPKVTITFLITRLGKKEKGIDRVRMLILTRFRRVDLVY